MCRLKKGPSSFSLCTTGPASAALCLRIADLRRDARAFPADNPRHERVGRQPRAAHHRAVRQAVLGGERGRVRQITAVQDAPPVSDRGGDGSSERREIYGDRGWCFPLKRREFGREIGFKHPSASGKESHPEGHP